MTRRRVIVSMLAVIFLIPVTYTVFAFWIADGVPVCPIEMANPSHVATTSDGAGGAIVAWRDYNSGHNYDIYARRINDSGEVQWMTGGVPICTRSSEKQHLEIISDGAKGAIITWGEGAFEDDDIYAQRVDSNGVVQWTVGGETICTEPSYFEQHHMAPDGAGGAFIVWTDERNGTDVDIYAQRVDASGAVQWAANGIAICAEEGNQQSPQIITDGTGGAIITWRDSRIQSQDIYAQRVDASGASLWTAGGVPVCTVAGYKNPPQISSDSAGRAIITWEDYRTGTNFDIYAQRIDAGGIIQWAASGVAICTESQNQYEPQITPDGTGGAVITWEDYRSGTNRDIYAQRISTNGSVLWTANGVAICTAVGTQSSQEITSDGAGGAIIAWRDMRTGPYYYLYSQRVDAGGTIQWTADGEAIFTETSIGDNQIISDGAGGAIITWKDSRTGEDEIYAHRIDAGGAAEWAPQGIPICTTQGSQENPHVISDSAGGAIVTWCDDRRGSDDIYTQRIDDGGTAQWRLDGITLCTASGGQDDPHIIANGAGGAIVAWRDERSGTDVDIYTQQVDIGGAVQWTKNGVAVCTATGDQDNHQIITDDAGGAIVTWRDQRGAHDNIYAQRVATGGTPAWLTDGVAICTAIGNQSAPQITMDGAGGAIIIWEDSRDGNYDIYVQRVGVFGTPLWTTDGVAVCTASGDQINPQIVSDHSGGAIITWQDGRGADDNIYAQRIDTGGNVQWISDGVGVCTTAGNQSGPQIAYDGAGGAIITWEDYRTGTNFDIYAQRITSSGVTQWTTGGAAICTAPESQTIPRIVSAGVGGAVITWEDFRSGTNSDIYAQRVDDTGTVQLPGTSEAICTAAENQLVPQVTSDGAGGAIITWEDHRGDYPNIYAQNVTGPICDVQPSSIDFGDVNILQWKELSFTITNTGDTPLTGNVSESCDYFVIVSGEGPYTLAMDEFLEVTVRFEPVFEGTFNCTIENGNSNCSGVYCTGNAIDGPPCSVTPATIVLPNPVSVGASIDTSFTITNTGSGALIVMIDESSDQFSVVTGGGSHILYADQILPVTVRFEPTTTGTHLCTIETGNYTCSDVSITGSAYTCPVDSVLYVDKDATGAGDGSSWNDAYTELREALAIAPLCPAGTQIWVAEGTYIPTGGTDRNATFHLHDGLAVYGGFARTETMLSERDIAVHGTVLSGDIGVPNDNSDNSYHVVTGSGTDSTAVLDGFIVTGGHANEFTTSPHNNGGGMYNDNGSPTVTNIIFNHNSAAEHGGGMYNSMSGPVLVNVLFHDNSASSNGGGMYNTNTVAPVLENVTFNGNSASAGGGISNAVDCSPTLTNVIMWGDSASTGSEIENDVTCQPIIAFSLIEGCGGSTAAWDTNLGIDGGNNMDTDPLFVNFLGGDLRLQVGSPAVDAGDSTVPHLPTMDLAGHPRIEGTTVDMGAYEGEFVVTDMTVTTDPPGLDITVNDSIYAAPKAFTTGSGASYELGVVTPQQKYGKTYEFTVWSDGGDTTHTVIVPDTNITYTARFEWLYDYAFIDSTADVPGDQGGWVRIHFRRSHYDNPGEMQCPIAQYDIHRRVDDPVLLAKVLAEGKRITDDVVIILADGCTGLLSARSTKEGYQYLRYADRHYLVMDETVSMLQPGLWEVVGHVSAQQQTFYICLVPTLGDSSVTIPYSVYYISAHSTTPAVFFDSPPDSGYSIDNLPPGVPLGLAVAYNTGGGNQLTWDPSPESDFQYYRIYRGDSEDFIPAPGNLVHETATESWSDPEYDGWDVHYKITALDNTGNESDPASASTTTGDDLPQVLISFVLYQNAPNPFNPVTTIRFDLPMASHVKLSIFNVKGEIVSVVADTWMREGQRELTWKAVDSRGQAVSSGVYFCRLVAGDFVQTRKMVLLR